MPNTTNTGEVDAKRAMLDEALGVARGRAYHWALLGRFEDVGDMFATLALLGQHEPTVLRALMDDVFDELNFVFGAWGDKTPSYDDEGAYDIPALVALYEAGPEEFGEALQVTVARAMWREPAVWGAFRDMVIEAFLRAVRESGELGESGEPGES